MSKNLNYNSISAIVVKKEIYQRYNYKAFQQFQAKKYHEITLKLNATA